MGSKFGKGSGNLRQPSEVLSVLPSTGAGMPTVPAVVCLQSVFPQLFVGNWFCFHGDGSIHGPGVAAFGGLQAVGTPTSQTVPMAGNGLYCAPATRQVCKVATNYYILPTFTYTSGDFTIGGVGSEDAGTSPGAVFVGQWGTGSPSTFYIQFNTGGNFGGVYADRNAANHGLGAGTWYGGVEHFYMAAVSHVATDNNTVQPFIDGASAAGLTSLLDMSRSAGQFKIGSGTSGGMRSAFYTEMALQASDAAAIQNYLHPLPQGTRGEALTFARNSLASVTCPDGTVTWLPPNRPAVVASGSVQQARANLLYWSEDFSQNTWANPVNGSIASSSISNPYSTGTVQKLVENTSTGVHQTSPATAPSLLDNTTYTFSCFFKAAGRDQARLAVTKKDGTLSDTQFDLVGVRALGTGASIQSFGNGWYRCSITYNSLTGANAAIHRIGILNSSDANTYAGDGTSGLYIWGAQLEAASAMTNYIQSTAVQGIEPVPASAQLQTQNPTNLLLWSEDFSQSAWIKAGSVIPTITTNVAIAPDGTQSTDQVNYVGANFPRAEQTFVANGGTYTLSAWVRVASGTLANCQIQFFDNTSSASVALTSVTLTTTWQRVSVTATPTSGHSIAARPLMVNSSGVTGSFQVWGAQLEQNSFATPYVKSTSTQGIYPAYVVNTGAGLKMRPAVTNLLLNSEQLGVSGFVDVSITVTANTTIAPDGSLTADTATGAIASRSFRQSSITPSAGTTYTFSAWLKSNTGVNQTLQMGILDTTGNNWAANTVYSLGTKILATASDGKVHVYKVTTAGTSGATQPASWTSTSGGTVADNSVVWTEQGFQFLTSHYTSFTLTSNWQRFSVTTDSAVAATNIIAGYLTTNTTSTNVSVWGQQLETGSIMSDYIRSEGTSGVMAAETCTVPMPGVRTNLYTWSQDLSNATWAKSNGPVTVAANASTPAPDGSMTVYNVSNTPSSSSFIDQAFTLTIGVTYTRSVYAKLITGRTILAMETKVNGAQSRVEFNLTTGLIDFASTNGTVASIINVGNGWYRCSTTITAAAAGDKNEVFYIGAYGATATATTIALWGAQLEIGSAASNYIPTTSAVGTVTALNPTVDSRNLLLQSEAFDSTSVWSSGHATITANATTAPDGSSNADKLVTDATVSTQHYRLQNFANGAVADNSNVTFSVYAKAAEFSRVELQIGPKSGGTQSDSFNLSSGTAITNNRNPVISSVGSGWYRCSITVNMGSGASVPKAVILLVDNTGNDFFNGDGTSGLYIWGAQLEVGSQATEYRQTTSVIGNYQPGYGNVYYSLIPNWTGSYPLTVPSVVLDASSSGSARLGTIFNGSPNMRITDGVNTPLTTANFTAGVQKSFRGSWNQGSRTLAIYNTTDGNSASSTFGGFPSFGTVLQIGSNYAGSLQINSASISDIVLGTDPNFGVIK
jgi:hypothetical protein